MALSRKNRFDIKTQLLDGLLRPDWSTTRINVMLREFGLTKWDSGGTGLSLDEIIADVSDDVLIEIYAIVMGASPEYATDAVESTAGSGFWKPGYARVFLSHSSQHSTFVREISNELALVGIDGFLTDEDSMEFSKPWQSQIETALRSMQAFVAIVHPESNASEWCHQEIGWAKGRKVPLYAVRCGVDPVDFIGRDQWPKVYDQTPSRVASIISAWVSTLPELGKSVTEGLFESLRTASSFIDAGTAATRIASLGALTEEQWAQLNAIFWSNDQVHGGALPSKALQPFYRDNKRDWPPAKPS